MVFVEPAVGVFQSLLSAGSVGEDVSEQVHPFRIENFKMFEDVQTGLVPREDERHVGFPNSAKVGGLVDQFIVSGREIV